MNGVAPLELGQLLSATDALRREAAWDSLIAQHTRLILSIAATLGGGRDEVMDRYAYVLESLRERDFHRLRVFREDGRARFSTWLAVTTRRLCLDRLRAQYGRVRPGTVPAEASQAHLLRRRLIEGLATDLDITQLPDHGRGHPGEDAVREARDTAVTAELALLAPDDRLLLTYRFEDDLSAARIARLLKFPTPFHVYRRVNYLLAQLRRGLRSRGIEGVDG